MQKQSSRRGRINRPDQSLGDVLKGVVVSLSLGPARVAYLLLLGAKSVDFARFGHVARMACGYKMVTGIPDQGAAGRVGGMTVR
jgi:hypothetical protein